MTLLGWWATWLYRNGSHSMGFSLTLTLFVCPSCFFFLHLSKHDDQICLFSYLLWSFRWWKLNQRSLKVCNPPSFHSRILVMCLLSLSSFFFVIEVPLELPGLSTFGRILLKDSCPPFCTCSVVASYPKTLYWHCLTKETTRSFQEWTREGSKLVYQVTATPVRLSWKKCINNSSSFTYAPIFRQYIFRWFLGK